MLKIKRTQGSCCALVSLELNFVRLLFYFLPMRMLRRA